MPDSRPFSPVCQHGSLRRSCEVCDLAERLDYAELERDEARADLSGLRAKWEREFAFAQRVTDEADALRALLRECRKVLDGEWAKAEKRKRLIARLDDLLGGRDE